MPAVITHLLVLVGGIIVRFCDKELKERRCVSVGDGRMGHSEEAPYDAIHVGAAAPVVPQAVSVSAPTRTHVT